MKTRLQNQKIANIQKEYENNQWYRIISLSCKPIEYKLYNLRPCPEEFFIDTLRILDDMKEKPSLFLSNKLPILWDTIQAETMQLAKGDYVAEQNNYATITLGLVIFALHWCDSNYYYSKIKNALMNHLIEKDSAHLGDYLTDLSLCIENNHEVLQAWINDYIKSDEYLSDSIHDMLKNKGNGHGNDAPREETRPYTLKYTCRENQQRDLRLYYFEQYLVNVTKWLVSPKKAHFIEDFFSGEIIECNLVWKGNLDILYRLIKTLTEQKNFIKKIRKGSASAIVKGQFHKTLNQGSIKEEDMTHINFLVRLLDPNTKIPTPEQRTHETNKYDINQLKIVLDEGLKITNHT